MIGSIAATELKRLSRSPLTWTLLGLSTFLLAFLFLVFLDHFSSHIQPNNHAQDNPVGVTRAIVLPVLNWAGIILLGILPLISMRSLSEEHQKQTWPLLASSPARPWQIIMGKYLAIVGFLTFVIAIILLMPLSLYFASEIDSGALISSALGLWLLLISATAAGIYFSSLTSEAGTAALATFGLLLFLYVLQISANMPGKASPLFYYLSPWTHFSAFLRARFNSIHLVYFLLFTSLFLWLAIRQTRKKLNLDQASKVFSLLNLAIGISTVIFISWLSIRYNISTDLSLHKSNSLPPEAVTILGQMDQPLTITAVVANQPQIHRRIKAALEPFLQQKKDIKLKFVDNRLQRLESAENLTETGELIVEYNKQKLSLNSLEQKQLINTLYQLKLGKQPWIIFLEGHGELNTLNKDTQGASHFAEQLQKQGFKTYSLNLIRNPAIPDNTDILVIAGANSQLLDRESQIILNYIDKGGNLFWLHDNDDLLGLEKLRDTLPMEFLPGTIVNANQAVQELIGSEHPAVFPVIDYNNHPLTKALDGQSVMAFSRALEATGQPPWKTLSFLQTPAESWNETGALEGHIKPDKENEQSGPFSVGMGFVRQVGEYEQRIIVTGDKDFISNELIGYGSNSELALRIINWLYNKDAEFVLPPKSVPDATLAMSQSQSTLIAVLFLLALPALFLLAGLRQWRHYRVTE